MSIEVYTIVGLLMSIGVGSFPFYSKDSFFIQFLQVFLIITAWATMAGVAMGTMNSHSFSIEWWMFSIPYVVGGFAAFFVGAFVARGYKRLNTSSLKGTQ